MVDNVGWWPEMDKNHNCQPDQNWIISDRLRFNLYNTENGFRRKDRDRKEVWGYIRYR